MAVSRATRSTRVGIHTFVWSATTTETILEILPRVAASGYTGVEVPILTPGSLDIPRIRAALREHDLACTASSALPKGYSLIDASTRDATVHWLARGVEDAAALGSPVLCGPLLTPIGEMRGRGRTQEEWETSVGALRELGDRIAGSGVTIALEPLNRFESFVVNTVEDAVRLVHEVARPAIRLLLDPFHMNIEEDDIPAAIAHACEYTAHFHLSENHRGSIGTGHIPWDAVLAELDAGGYDGWLVVESFGSALPDLASAASIWRPMAASPDALAAESMAFLAGRLN
ncbi:MAG: sugar phosphate isomerase/epimerase family protein [Thermomicrobiales bacterium]